MQLSTKCDSVAQLASCFKRCFGSRNMFFCSVTCTTKKSRCEFGKTRNENYKDLSLGSSSAADAARQRNGQHEMIVSLEIQRQGKCLNYVKHIAPSDLFQLFREMNGQCNAQEIHTHKTKHTSVKSRPNALRSSRSGIAHAGSSSCTSSAAWRGDERH